MFNSFKYIYITILIRLLQAFKVSIAIFLNQISYYPNSVKSFEKKFREETGSLNALMFSNATSAMEAALFSIGINEDSYVGSTAFVIPSSYSSAKSLQARVIFFDIDANSLNICIDNIEEFKRPLSAIIVTHFYGNPCDMERIMQWATKNNIYVIEDCSHAHGAEYKGKPLGSWGHIGVFSLQGAKAVAAGEGAVVISNDSELMIKMAAYGHQESYKSFNIEVEPDITIPSFGYGKKMRAHPLGAILALEELKKLNFKNKIYTSWFKELEEISKKNKFFKLPEILINGKIGGFCQGLPLILESQKAAFQLRNELLKNSINCFMRDYTQNIIDFSEDYSTKSEVGEFLPKSFNSFSQVIFIPFYQFLFPWRWIRLKSILHNCNYEK